MDEKPKRRWLQFRLSTWFVLVAILGWAMIARPALDYGSSSDRFQAGPARGISVAAYLDFPVQILRGEFNDDADNVCLTIDRRSPGGSSVYWLAIIPKHSGWPILALAVFLTWKAASTVIERRRLTEWQRLL